MESENTSEIALASASSVASITFCPSMKGYFSKVMLLDGQPPMEILIQPDNTNLPNSVMVTLTGDNYIEFRHGKVKLKKRKSHGK